MFKQIALTTFLFGTVNAADPACYPTYSSADSDFYSSSDPVTRISYVTTKLKCCSKSTTCPGGTSRCSSSDPDTDGTKKVGCTVEGTDGCICKDNGTTDTFNNESCASTETEVKTPEANNYACKNEFCRQDWYAPGTIYVDSAWEKIELCDVSFYIIYVCIVLYCIVDNLYLFQYTLKHASFPPLYNQNIQTDVYRPSCTHRTSSLEYSHTSMSQGMGTR